MIEEQEKGSVHRRPTRAINSNFRNVMDYLLEIKFPVVGLNVYEDTIAIHSITGQSIIIDTDQTNVDEEALKVINGG